MTNEVNAPRPTRGSTTQHSRRPLRALTCACAVAFGLGGCGGSSTDAKIGGSVSGLATGTTMVLQNNGSDNITITANSSFSFPTKVGTNSSYAVTVLNQPTGQLCTVGSGSGTVDSKGDDVTTVTVTCASNSTVGGTVSGLATGAAVTLSNGQILLPVAINGAFSFPGTLGIGATYNITVATQPVGQTCTVLNGSGTVGAGVAVIVTVTCTP